MDALADRETVYDTTTQRLVVELSGEGDLTLGALRKTVDRASQLAGIGDDEAVTLAHSTHGANEVRWTTRLECQRVVRMAWPNTSYERAAQ